MKIVYDEILRDTGKAIQIAIDGKKIWIPVSQIQREKLYRNEIIVSEWWCRKNENLRRPTA